MPKHPPSPVDLPERPHVAVLLGTDHHPFDRLVSWSCALATEDGKEWFVQHGYTSWPPTDAPPNVAGAKILGIADLTAVLEHADVVVTHGGPGLIMEAHAAGHIPVVVPRAPHLGEHVDGHQQDFAARLEAEGTILRVDTLPEFRAAVRDARAQGRLQRGRTGAPRDTVAKFGDLVDGAVASPRVSPLRRLLRAGR